MPVDIQEFFRRGMDREIPQLLEGPPGLPTLELGPGSGKKRVDTDYKLDYPNWNAETDRIPSPFVAGRSEYSWGEIHAYHFMEHLSGEGAMYCLKNMEHALHRDGVINLVIPYYNSAMMAQALDHKSHWSEETWRWLFGDTYNDAHTRGWNLKVHTCFIMGIVERNLALFTQLVKIER